MCTFFLWRRHKQSDSLSLSLSFCFFLSGSIYLIYTQFHEHTYSQFHTYMSILHTYNNFYTQIQQPTQTSLFTHLLINSLLWTLQQKNIIYLTHIQLISQVDVDFKHIQTVPHTHTHNHTPFPTLSAYTRRKIKHFCLTFSRTQKLFHSN